MPLSASLTLAQSTQIGESQSCSRCQDQVIIAVGGFQSAACTKNGVLALTVLDPQFSIFCINGLDVAPDQVDMPVEQVTLRTHNSIALGLNMVEGHIQPHRHIDMLGCTVDQCDPSFIGVQ